MTAITLLKALRLQRFQQMRVQGQAPALVAVGDVDAGLGRPVVGAPGLSGEGVRDAGDLAVRLGDQPGVAGRAGG